MAEILWDAPVSPSTLTAFITKYVPAPAKNVLTSLVSVNYVESDRVKWGAITRRNRMAKYRAYDGMIARTGRDVAAEQWVNLPPFSNSDMVGEYETMQREYARLQGGNKAALADAIYNDAINLTNTMWNRVEKALGDLIPTGHFTVQENQTTYDADYGIPVANRITAAVPWTSPAALAADELRAMVTRYQASAGVRPARLITSGAVLSALQRNVQVVGEAAGTISGRTRLTLGELTAWLDSERLPTLITEVEGQMYDDEADKLVRVWPEDLLVLAPADLGSVVQFTFGLSASAMELRSAPDRVNSTFGDDRIVGMVLKDGPPFRQYTYVDAIGLPVLAGADQIVVGDVL